MRTVEAIGRQGLKLILSSPPVYALLRRVIGTKIVPLPSKGEARCILMAASQRPPIAEVVPARCWPTVPEYDVSVIVPCFNVEKYISECIESILDQTTTRSLEVLAIDDGSTDDTGAILDELGSRDVRLRIVHQENKGLGAARNVGISMARGAAFVFVDADDVLEPFAVEAMTRAFEVAPCDYVTASYNVMGSSGTGVKSIAGRRTHGAPWARLYSREVWRDLGYPEGYLFEDTVQAYCITPRFREVYLDECVYRHRRRSGSIVDWSSRSQRGLDSFWITGEMLLWCDRLGIPLDQRLFDQTIKQLGPLLYQRTRALTEVERRALFAASCELLNGRDEWSGLATTLGGRWQDVALALRNGDYGLWRLAVSSM